MALQSIITTAGSADKLNVAGGKINTNKAYLDTTIDTETADREISLADTINLQENNYVSNPVLYQNTRIFSAATVTIDLNSGSPNFYLTHPKDSGTLTISNPSGLQAGESQEGYIVTKTSDITWGSKFALINPLVDTYNFLWFNYYVINENNIVVVLAQELTA